ncbi:hypothetical protein Misp05_31230 [Micromonospora sp. NBRC 107095]|nr:hypothetical protein Misp05_31230 [Micromonospora sp. NBRC 107095]
MLGGQRGRGLRRDVGDADQFDVVEPGQYPRVALRHAAGSDQTHPAFPHPDTPSKTFQLRWEQSPGVCAIKRSSPGNALTSPL